MPGGHLRTLVSTGSHASCMMRHGACVEGTWGMGRLADARGASSSLSSPCRKLGRQSSPQSSPAVCTRACHEHAEWCPWRAAHVSRLRAATCMRHHGARMAGFVQPVTRTALNAFVNSSPRGADSRGSTTTIGCIVFGARQPANPRRAGFQRRSSSDAAEMCANLARVQSNAAKCCQTLPR